MCNPKRFRVCCTAFGSATCVCNLETVSAYMFSCTQFSSFCRGFVQETAAADQPGEEAHAAGARGAGSQQEMADVPSEQRVRPMINFEVFVTGGHYPRV